MIDLASPKTEMKAAVSPRMNASPRSDSEYVGFVDLHVFMRATMAAAPPSTLTVSP